MPPTSISQRACFPAARGEPATVERVGVAGNPDAAWAPTSVVCPISVSTGWPRSMALVDLEMCPPPWRRSTTPTTAATAPIGGVPLPVKDLVCEVAGVTFHEGGRDLRCVGYVPGEDQDLFRRFKATGLVALGKAKTAELGLTPTTEPSVTGATRDPWDLYLTPGRSGGGLAAVAVAN
jgi:Amidase